MGEPWVPPRAGSVRWPRAPRRRDLPRDLRAPLAVGARRCSWARCSRSPRPGSSCGGPSGAAPPWASSRWSGARRRALRSLARGAGEGRRRDLARALRRRLRQRDAGGRARGRRADARSRARLAPVPWRAPRRPCARLSRARPAGGRGGDGVGLARGDAARAHGGRGGDGRKGDRRVRRLADRRRCVAPRGRLRPGPERVAAAPRPAAAVHHAMAVGARGKLYCLGGYSAAGAAVSTPTCSTGRGGDDCRRCRSRALPPGPRSRTGRSSSRGARRGPAGQERARVRPRTRRWSVLPGPTPREHLGVTSLAGTVYAVAGRTAGIDTNLLEFESYRPGDRRWKRLPPVPDPRGGTGAAA